MKKLFLKNFGWPLFRDCETSPPKDGPASFVAGRQRDNGFSGFGGGVAHGAKS